MTRLHIAERLTAWLAHERPMPTPKPSPEDTQPMSLAELRRVIVPDGHDWNEWHHEPPLTEWGPEPKGDTHA